MATIRHVSSGTFLCGSCEEPHPFVSFSLDHPPSGDRAVFMLPGEDAVRFATAVLEGNESIGNDCSYEPNVCFEAQLVSSQDENGASYLSRIDHVSSGIRHCDCCEALHPYVAFSVGHFEHDGRTVFVLEDEDAVSFSQAVRSARAEAG